MPDYKDEVIQAHSDDIKDSTKEAARHREEASKTKINKKKASHIEAAEAHEHAVKIAKKVVSGHKDYPLGHREDMDEHEKNHDAHNASEAAWHKTADLEKKGYVPPHYYTSDKQESGDGHEGMFHTDLENNRTDVFHPDVTHHDVYKKHGFDKVSKHALDTHNAISDHTNTHWGTIKKDDEINNRYVEPLSQDAYDGNENTVSAKDSVKASRELNDSWNKALKSLNKEGKAMFQHHNDEMNRFYEHGNRHENNIAHSNERSKDKTVSKEERDWHKERKDINAKAESYAKDAQAHHEYRANHYDAQDHNDETADDLDLSFERGKKLEQKYNKANAKSNDHIQALGNRADKQAKTSEKAATQHARQHDIHKKLGNNKAAMAHKAAYKMHTSAANSRQNPPVKKDEKMIDHHWKTHDLHNTANKLSARAQQISQKSR